jgi:hypothetical protein
MEPGVVEYLQSRLVRVGLGLLILGVGPLLFIIVAAAVGLWPDPNPNPIGPGFLAFLTFVQESSASRSGSPESAVEGIKPERRD